MEGILPDGANISRPPGFVGEHYSFWKNKFKVFVMASEFGLWRVFERGDYIPSSTEDGVRVPKLEEEFDDNDKKLVVLNSKAVLMLQSALSQNEYFRVCNKASAKEMWDTLELAHEGTTGVKENRVNTLMTEYDLIRMKQGETIDEFRLRFTHLINQLTALGKIYDEPVQVRKILNTLSKDWEAKVTAIEEARGASMASVAALFGSLSEYEGKLKFRKGIEEINNKSKGIALKTIKEAKETDDDDEEDEEKELGMIVQRFKRFYRKGQGYKKFHKGSSSTEPKKPIICYECEKPGHIKSECPQLNNKDKEKKKFNRFKKKAYVSSIWGDSSSDEDEADEEDKANICLVAEEEEQNDSNNEVYDSKPSYDELFAEYIVVQTEFEKLAQKYVALKRKNTTLELQIEKTSSLENSDCEDCPDLKKRNLHLTKALEKFTRGSEMLNVILKEQRFTNDRSGIGYKPKFDKRKGKKKFGEKSYMNYFRKSVHSSNPFAHCNYCNRKGHSTSSCFHKNERKNKPSGNYQWVPKGSYKIPMTHTNPKGPKKRWVPKT